MSSIPGFQFNITGASGSQGLLAPQSSWRAYILPRGGHASQSSTGTLITFDSASVAARFGAADWIQAGLNTANIRQVSAVGGNSLSVSGAAVTVSENDRIFVIGRTQPTVTGGSATYTVPATRVYQRDDDGADLFTNSMITSNADGLIQGWAAANLYDAIIQDGNGSNQGSIIDLVSGVAEGVSTSGDVTIGGSLTVHGGIGVTGWATFGSSVTMHAALGVTGTLTVGASATFHGAVGVTGTLGVSGAATFRGTLGVTSVATFGATVTMSGALGVTGTAAIGATLTAHANAGFTGTVVFGSTITVGGVTGNNVIFGTTATINRSLRFAASSTYFGTSIIMAGATDNIVNLPPGLFIGISSTATGINCFTGSGLGRLVYLIGVGTGASFFRSGGAANISFPHASTMRILEDEMVTLYCIRGTTVQGTSWVLTWSGRSN